MYECASVRHTVRNRQERGLLLLAAAVPPPPPLSLSHLLPFLPLRCLTQMVDLARIVAGAKAKALQAAQTAAQAAAAQTAAQAAAQKAAQQATQKAAQHAAQQAAQQAAKQAAQQAAKKVSQTAAAAARTPVVPGRPGANGSLSAVAPAAGPAVSGGAAAAVRYREHIRVVYSKSAVFMSRRFAM